MAPNAYNGVINIITPAARDIVGTKLTLGGGELGTARADLRQAGVLLHGRLGYRVNVGYTPQRRLDAVPHRQGLVGLAGGVCAGDRDAADGSRARTDTPQWADQRLRHRRGDSARPTRWSRSRGPLGRTTTPCNGSIVTLEGGAGQVDNSVTISGTGRNQAPSIVRPWARLAWDRHGSGVSAWYTGLSVSARSDQARLRTATQNTRAALHLEGRTSRTFTGMMAAWWWGPLLQNNLVNSEGTILNPTYDDRSDQYYGAFGQVEYSMRRVRVIGAVRWDDSNLYTAQVSPKGALVFSPAKNHALRFTVGRAFLTPSLAPVSSRRHPPAPASRTCSRSKPNSARIPTVGPALAAVPERDACSPIPPRSPSHRWAIATCYRRR